MEVGAELGAKSLLSSIWTDDKARYMDQFAKMTELAGKYGLNVDLEFVTWASVWNYASFLPFQNGAFPVGWPSPGMVPLRASK